MSIKLLFQGLMTDVLMNFTGEIAALCFRLAMCCAMAGAQLPETKRKLAAFSEIFDVFFVAFASSSNLLSRTTINLLFQSLRQTFN